MEVFALGLNYQSAPLALRERVAFTAETVREALNALKRSSPAAESAILSTCNRTELYCAEGEPAHALEWLVRFPQASHRRAEAASLHAAARGSGAPRVPRRLRSGLDGARRAADPRADEGGGALGRRGRRARHDAQPALPALVRGGEGRAHQHQGRRERRLDGRRRGEARVADLPDLARSPRALHRRGRDDRTLRDAFRRAHARAS